jgi:hypothetical protein
MDFDLLGPEDLGIDPLFSSHRRPTDKEIREIVDRFIHGEVSEAEGDAALERLELAKKRVLPVLIELCRSPDPQEHQTGATLVREMDLLEAIDPLREMLEDPLLDDEHKVSILSALQPLGGIEPDENPYEYFRDPEAVARKSYEDFLTTLRDPLRFQTILSAELESGESLLTDPRFLASVAQGQDQRILPLLLCMLHVPDDDTVLGAINALKILEAPAALSAVEERASYDPSPKVRKAARKVASYLTQVVPEPVPSILDLPVAPPPVVRCMVSTIDGSGGQICVVSRQTSESERLVLDVMFNDHEGIKDCVAGGADDVQDLEELLVEGMAEIGVEMVEVTLQQACAELDRAYRITLQAHRRLPPTYHAWRPWLCGDDPRPVEIFPLPTVSAEEREDLFDQCDELLDLEEFSSWLFDVDNLSDLLRKFKKLTRREGSEDAVEALVTQGVERVMNADRRRLLRERLERQAWLLAQVYEDVEIPKLAMVAAAGLGDGANVRPADHPLLREMMYRTLTELADTDS